MEEPLPTAVPPQLPLYHCQFAPLPRAPPLTLNVAVPPEHKVAVVVLADAGAVELLLTLIACEAQAVLLQEPSART